MTDRQPPQDGASQSHSASARPRLRSVLEQFRQDCRLYNEAIGSYNTHLDNHRERRELQAIPFRSPVTAADAFDDAVEGDRAAIEALLSSLLDEAHLDSQLRRHPRTYPIHLEAAEHLEIARDRLVATLEDALYHIDGGDD